MFWARAMSTTAEEGTTLAVSNNGLHPFEAYLLKNKQTQTITRS
jgi:hypothetical protein